MGLCFFPVWSAGHFFAVRCVSRNGVGYAAFGWNGNVFGQSQIAPNNQPVCKLPRQIPMSRIGFGSQHDSAGQFIEPMNNTGARNSSDSR